MAARKKPRPYTPEDVGLSRDENRRRVEIQSSWNEATRAKRSCYPQYLYQWLLPVVRSPLSQDHTTGCLAEKLVSEDEGESQVRAFEDGLERGLEDLSKAADDDDDQQPDTRV